MPGFTTHFIFGQQFLDALTKPHLKHLISTHRNVFNYGLQGPDFFFYYLPGFLIPAAPNPGSAAHTKETKKLFSYFFRSRNLFNHPKERATADAYLLGLIGHYLLDRSCHPYVYARTGADFARSDYLSHHMFLESDIDTLLLEKYFQIPPSCFDAQSTILLTRFERRIAARMIAYAYNHTFQMYHFSVNQICCVMRFMPLSIRLLHDKTGHLKSAVRKSEELLFHKPFVSPLILSDTLRFYIDPMNLSHHTWKNPWDTTRSSQESFLELMEKALDDFLSCTVMFSSFSKSSLPVFPKDLLLLLGNDSYHSGLSCSANSPLSGHK